MDETFGQWLTRKREGAGLNQTELAERAGVTKATISLYEKDAVIQPRFKQLDKIAKALKMPSSEIRQIFADRNSGLSTPQNITQLMNALKHLGIPIDHIEPFNLSPDDYSKLLDDIRLVIELRARR